MEYTVEDLRKRNRNLRAGLAQAAQDLASINLGERIISLPEYKRANRIAVYFAVNGEISLDFVVNKALAQEKQIFLPNLDQQLLRFSPFFHGQKMRINRYKIPEPDVGDSEILASEALDLVLAPMVVFDAKRNRIGMGGGFYDRSFAFIKDSIQSESRPVLIGVAHELQRVEQLEPEDWDVQLDMVVTDQAIYR